MQCLQDRCPGAPGDEQLRIDINGQSPVVLGLLNEALVFYACFCSEEANQYKIIAISSCSRAQESSSLSG